MVSARLLVVEDQSIIALDLKNRLTGLGYSVVGTAAYAEAAIQEASALRPDLVLMDIRLKGDMDGIEAAERIRAELDLPVIFLTAHSDERTLQRARLSEPYGYILKPFEDREVHMAIEIALYKHQMEARLKAHERWLAATLTSIGDAVIATDQAGRIEFMNPAAEAATGWTQADAIGRDLGQVFRLVHDETRAPLLSPVAAGLQDGARFESTDHAVLVARDGSEVPIEDSAAPIRDERGALTGVVLVFHDVTERRRAERRLQASEKQFRQVVEHIHDALIREDAGGQITFANEQFLTLFGLARPQLAALRPADCVAPEWRDQWQAWRDRQQRGEAATFEYEGLCRDGQRLWLEGDRTPLWDEAGRMIGAQTVIRDITARKQAEAALQASERRFRALIENSSAGITVIDPAGLLRYASPSTSRILGFAPNERQGRPITELLHPDDAPEVLAQLEQLRQTPGGSVTRLFRARHRAGHWRWLEATATNLLDDPAVGGLVVNFDDITERKRADEQLRLLSRAVQQSPVSIIITDTAGRIEYVNPHFTEVTGYQRAEVLGLNPSLLNAGQTPSAEYQRLWTTLAAGGEWRGEFCNKKKSGELFWQLAWISAIRNDRDEITHFVAVQEDITERRQAAEALRVSNIELTRLLAQAKDLAAAAQQANRLKDEILANTSHELRTPLTAIMGALDIVLGGLYTSDDEMRAFVHAARDAADRLLHLVNDLLDLAKLEAGRLQPKREIVDLPALLADVQALMRGQAGPKGLALEVEWPDHPLPPCLGDAEHLRRILLNLLNNAVKFTAHGGITIAVRTAPGLPTRAGAGRQVQIAVQDTGIGIPLEMQPRLFQPFAQVDGSSTRRYGGTGLGLSISRQLAELMGGTLTLHSAGAGQGSTFTLSLPLLQS